MSQEAQTQAPAAPKKSRTLLLVIAVVTIAATIGAGAYWMYGRSSKSEAAAAEPVLPSAVIPQDPFVVNLADQGNPRFLRVTLGLVVAGDHVAKEHTEDPVARMQLRSSILELLSQQTAARLVLAEGKAELKKAIAQRASASADHLKVTDVLFTEFIVQ